MQRRLQMNDFGKNTSTQRFYPISQSQTPKIDAAVKKEEKFDCVEQNTSRSKKTEEMGTQTSDLVPYELLLNDICNQKIQEASSESPTILLDRYIETCVATNSFGDCNKSS